MARIQLEAFKNNGAQGTMYLNSTKIYPNTLQYIVLQLGGTVPPLKSELTRIQVKVGTSNKPLWDVTGAQLDLMNLYEGRPSTATVFVLPFDNPRARTIESQMQGTMDMAGINQRELNLEIVVAGGTAPTLTAWAEVAPPGISKGPNRQLFRALLTTPLAFTGAQTRKPETLAVGQNGGALLRRLFMFPATLGNVTAFQLMRDSVPYFDDVPAVVNDAVLDELGHDPQPEMYVFDAIDDDNESKALTSLREDDNGISLIPQQYNFTVAAAGNVPVVADVHTTLNGL